MKKTARAYTNIALVKYWGKVDEQLIIPQNSSLSLTLDAFYTDTSVTLLTDEGADEFYLNGVKQTKERTKRVSQFIDHFRALKGTDVTVRVDSTNHVPTAAGLASSASAFAALALAANEAFQLQLNQTELSRLARRGSGSASRSIYGGFVKWQKGTDDESSFAVPVDDANWDVGMLVILINTKEKATSSRIGMRRTVDTSPFYKEWVSASERDITLVEQAIKNQDIEQLGYLTEANALRMHSVMLSANPPLLYWEPETIKALRAIEHLRNKGYHCYSTMDAGPNVKVLCKYSEALQLKKELENWFSHDEIIISKVGKDAYVKP